MKNRLARKGLMTASLLIGSLAATPALASWYINQSEGYYKPQEYHNEKYGNFPPADIDQKLFSHLNSDDVTEESKPPADNPHVSSNNQAVPPANPQVSNPAPNYPAQDFQRPAYGNYSQNRNYAPYGNQRNNRSTNFNGPRNNNRSSFSGPWNNNGSSFSGPWNNNGSSFGGPWNNNGSSFGGPWNNNGSSFSMPWGNNNRSGSGFNPMGNGGGWGW